ncbi:MAG: hypothetical protein ABI411_15725 [Tahibacter sp.]
MNPQSKMRLQLVMVGAVFLVPMLIAFGLRLANWQPERLRNIGELVQPPQDLASNPIASDRGEFAWKDPDYRWTLLLLAGPACGDACEAQLANAEKVRGVMTSKATRVRLAVIGVEATDARRARYPQTQFLRSDAPALQALRPSGNDAIAAVVIDPAGLLVLRYAPGFDPSGVRQDLARVIR